MRDLRHVVFAGDVLEDHARLAESFFHRRAHLGQFLRITARKRLRQSKDTIGDRLDGIRAALRNRGLRFFRRRADRREHELLDADLRAVEVQRINPLVEEILNFHVLLGHRLDHHRVALIGLFLKLTHLIRSEALRLLRARAFHLGILFLHAFGLLRRLLSRSRQVDGIRLAHALLGLLFNSRCFLLRRVLRRLPDGGRHRRIRHLRVGGNIVDSHFTFLLEKYRR